MEFLNLISILEAKLEREIVTVNGEHTITYKGNINSVTVNGSKEYTKVYQLFLTHSNNNITLHVNHSKNTHTTDYDLSDITSLVIS